MVLFNISKNLKLFTAVSARAIRNSDIPRIYRVKMKPENYVVNIAVESSSKLYRNKMSVISES